MKIAAIRKAIGAMIWMIVGIASIVSRKNTQIVWPLAVTTSSSRRICVIHNTPTSAPSVMAKATVTRFRM